MRDKSPKAGLRQYVRILEEPVLLGSHDYFIRCIAFSPDGGWLAVGDEESLVSVRTADDGSAVTYLKGHRDAVYTLTFIGNDFLATGSWDRTVRVWDRPRGACECVLRGHIDRVAYVAMSPLTGVLVSADEAGDVLEFNPDKGILFHHWSCHESRIRALIVDATGWISTGDDGRIVQRRWGEEPAQRAFVGSACYGIAGPLPGEAWAVACADGLARHVELASGTVTVWASDQAYIRAIDLPPDQSRLALGGKSGNVILLTSTGEVLGRWTLPEAVLDLRWITPTLLVGCGRGGMTFALIEEAPSSWRVEIRREHNDDVFALAVAPDGRAFVTGGLDGRIYRWSVEPK